MRKYNDNQTGAKSQFGGVNHGFWSPAYQTGIAESVNTEPRAPAASQTTTDIAKRIRFGLVEVSYSPLASLVSEPSS